MVGEVPKFTPVEKSKISEVKNVDGKNVNDDGKQ